MGTDAQMMLSPVAIEAEDLKIVGKVAVDDLSVEIHRGSASEPFTMRRTILIDMVNREKYAFRDATTGTSVAIMLKNLVFQTIKPFLRSLSKAIRVEFVSFNLITTTAFSAFITILKTRLGWSLATTWAKTSHASFSESLSIPTIHTLSVLFHLLRCHLFTVHSVCLSKYAMNYTTEGGEWACHKSGYILAISPSTMLSTRSI